MPLFPLTLHRAVGIAQLEILPAAGHMLHVDAPRRFQALVTGFASPVLGELAPR